jgi:photosystem II stability/assembly factor-like uncharacterized protein
MRMSATPELPVICLSVNGNTLCESERAARTLLVATTEGVYEFGRAELHAPWSCVRKDILTGNHISALVHEPRSGLLFAGLHFQGGLQVSADRGRTWEARNDGLQSGHVYTLLVKYLGSHTVLYLGTEPAMLYRSDDLGLSWTALPAMRDVPDTDKWFFPRSVPHIKNIASHPSQAQTLYVCVEQGDLLKSIDGGKSWRQLSSLDRPDDKFRRDMHRVTFRKDDAQELFLTSGIGLYHSTDGGDSWEHITDPSFVLGYPDPFFIHPVQPNVMFMAGAGASPNPDWAKMGTANPRFMRSTDSGRSWVDAMSGFRRPVRGNIEAAALHYSHEGGLELFAGTACGELYTSRDEAKSWVLVSEQIDPVSKGPHFRHFLSSDKREAYESKLRAIGAFS